MTRKYLLVIFLTIFSFNSFSQNLVKECADYVGDGLQKQGCVAADSGYVNDSIGYHFLFNCPNSWTAEIISPIQIINDIMSHYPDIIMANYWKNDGRQNKEEYISAWVLEVNEELEYGIIMVYSKDTNKLLLLTGKTK